MKLCNKCKVEKDESEFSKCNSKKNKSGVKSYCLECGRLMYKKWAKSNPEKIKKRNSSDRKREINKEYDRNNLEKRRHIGKNRNNRMPPFYIRDLLISKGFTIDQINNYPVLLDIQRSLILNKREIKKQLNANENQ